MTHIDDDQRRARLGLRHMLVNPAATPEDAAEAMVGLHASDPATVYLSARARLGEFARPDLEAVLYEERSLLRMLGMRRTMFVVTRPIAATMDAACTKALVDGQWRRLVGMVEEGGLAADGAAWLASVCDATLEAIAVRGEAVAMDLRKDVPELSMKIRLGEGKKWGGDFGLSTRVLFLLATEGRIIRGRPRGSWLSSQYRWVATERWLGGPLPVIEMKVARRKLVDAWLSTFGPGTLTDIQWWTGWNKRDTVAALEDAEAVEVTLDEGVGYVQPGDDQPVPVPDPWAAMLPGLDPTPMGWKEREWFLGPHGADVFDRNGNVGPTVWLNGRIVGGWAQAPSGEVIAELLEHVANSERRLIEAERVRLEDWLGEARVTPRFRSPLDKRLVDAK